MRDSSLVETCCVMYTEGLFHLGLDNAAFSGLDKAVLTVYSYQEECLTGTVEIMCMQLPQDSRAKQL